MRLFWVIFTHCVQTCFSFYVKLTEFEIFCWHLKVTQGFTSRDTIHGNTTNGGTKYFSCNEFSTFFFRGKLLTKYLLEIIFPTVASAAQPPQPHSWLWSLNGRGLEELHGVWKLQKKSHSTLRAKRATFTKNGQFWWFFENLKLAVKQCYQTGHF